MSRYLREMPSGDLLGDPGAAVPDIPEGYSRDPEDKYRLHLVPVPADCVNRSERKCMRGATKRWWCTSKGLVNPGVCCRCQKLVKPFANPSHV